MSGIRPFPANLLKRFAPPLLIVLLVICWSSGFVGTRYASEEAGIFLVLFWRTFLSGLILLPFAVVFGTRLSARAIVAHMSFAVLSVYIYLGGFAIAIEQRVPTGLVALISDLVPLAIAALSQPLLGEMLSRWQWMGTFIAIAGVVVVTFDSLAIGTAPPWAYGVTVAAMLVFALASIFQRKHKILHVPAHTGLCIQSLTGAALFGLSALFNGDGLVPPLTIEFATGMVWLVLLATIATYSLYYYALRTYPAAKVSAFIYLSPPVTMIWAWFLFSEPLTWMMLVGLLITLTGIWITLRK